MTEAQISALREEMRAHMDEKRYAHTLGVEKEMRHLAQTLAPALVPYAAVAGLLHDVTKCLKRDEQLAYCQENGLSVDDDERLAPALLHAKTGAHYARTHYPELVTKEIVDAVDRHTTAHPPLSLLAAMLFVADFTEEGRDYPDCVALRNFLYEKELSGATGLAHFKAVVLKALDLSLYELLRDGRPIAWRTVEARNAMLADECLF